MATSLDVVALISGGKDSFFSLLHCIAQGHRVVALANLFPPSGGDPDDAAPVDDLESYMYQTIGHTVIPLYARALDLPLFRQEIRGGATNQAKSYHPARASSAAPADETESLVPLLERVRAAHPAVNAVSCGAIRSDYQRTRVESVALRLGLTPLAFLWQWPALGRGGDRESDPPAAVSPPSSLLAAMTAVGLDARIVKVASGGLDARFLWQNVADPRVCARLHQAAERFGSPDDDGAAALGEGGEYETLTLDGPAPVWKRRIVVAPENVLVVPGEAGSAAVRIEMPALADKEDDGAHSIVNLWTPPLLEGRFQSILDAVAGVGPSEGLDLRALPPPDDPALSDRDAHPPIREHVGAHENVLTLPWLCGTGTTVTEQAQSIMDQMLELLSAQGHDADNVAYAVVVLRHMSEFASFNAIYATYFTEPNPPARVTVGCAGVLPSESLLMLNLTSTTDHREGLHVQSRSYWAPANIGPYSQAIKFPEDTACSAIRGSVYISGQIPLVPASMELAERSDQAEAAGFAFQTVLALQHLVRIGAAMKTRHWISAIAFVTSSGAGALDASEKRAIVRDAWNALHSPQQETEEHLDDEDESFDVWHLQNRRDKASWRNVYTNNKATSRDQPDHELVPPLSIIEVDELPRRASIEWVGYGTTTDDRAVEAIPLHLQSLLITFRP